MTVPLATAAALARASTALFPLALMPLFQAKRFKVIYGGRGAGRSWGAARALLLLNLERPERTLCAREFQKSIADSVHRVIADQITKLQMNYLYDVQQARIIGRGPCAGAEFGFEGIRSNSDQIKSYEGAKRCWVEEAHRTSRASWEDLIPTIRTEGSEIWVTFNTKLETDETHKRFIVVPPGEFMRRTELVDGAGRPTGGHCVETTRAFIIFNSFRDNPWFPEVLRAEMEELRARKYDEYLHVWEGQPKQTLEGAVYADELREIGLRNGIRSVPYDPALGVNVYFDLGLGHYTAAWFEQRSAWEHRFINFYKNRLKDPDHYMRYMQGLGYTYDTVWLPHDAFAKRLGHVATVAAQFREKGFHVREVPRVSIANGIAMTRLMMPTSYFDAERCADGIQDLRHYRFSIDEKTKQFSDEPLDDNTADTADALRYAGVASRIKTRGRMGRIAQGAIEMLLPDAGMHAPRERFTGPGDITGRGRDAGWMRG